MEADVHLLLTLFDISIQVNYSTILSYYAVSLLLLILCFFLEGLIKAKLKQTRFSIVEKQDYLLRVNHLIKGLISILIFEFLFLVVNLYILFSGFILNGRTLEFTVCIFLLLSGVLFFRIRFLLLRENLSKFPIAGLLRFLNFIFYFPFFPFSFLILILNRGLVKFYIESRPERDKTITEEEFTKILPSVKEFEEHERKFITRIIEFSDITVEEIMIPRVDIIAVDSKESINKIIELINRTGKTRIPVYKENLDNITGIIYSKELLKLGGKFKEVTVESLIKKPLFVPETTHLDDLLKTFKSQRTHIAVVIDEYGGTSGIVTIEDLLEEIVGEIEDEYDITQKPYMVQRDGTYIINAQTEIEKLNEELDLNLPEIKGIETIGGIILDKLGRIPKMGEKITINNLELIIEKAGVKKIFSIRVKINNSGKNNRDKENLKNN